MGLINYEQIENGYDATANLWNTRFGKIYDLVNGNLDSQNLKNGAVTREKVAPKAITSDKLDMNVYIDNAGWTVFDMGTTKRWIRKENMGSETMAANTWSNNRPVLPFPEGLVAADFNGGSVIPLVSMYAENPGWPGMFPSMRLGDDTGGISIAVYSNNAITMNNCYIVVTIERGV